MKKSLIVYAALLSAVLVFPGCSGGFDDSDRILASDKSVSADDLARVTNHLLAAVPDVRAEKAKLAQGGKKIKLVLNVLSAPDREYTRNEPGYMDHRVNYYEVYVAYSDKDALLKYDTYRVHKDLIDIYRYDNETDDYVKAASIEGRPGVLAAGQPVSKALPAVSAVSKKKVPAFSPAKAVDITPIKGVRLTAPENALDKPRTFQATPLSNAQLNELDKRLLPSGVEVLGGFELDAGMSDQDLFPGQLTIAFDLEKWGIPKELWDDLVLIHDDDSGKLRLLIAEWKGKELFCKVRHNGAVTLAILLPILAEVANYGWQVDRAQVPPGDYTSVFWPPEQRYFQLLYPRAWQMANPAEVERVTEELKRLNEKHKIGSPVSSWSDKSDAFAERIQRLRQLEQDPEYQSLRTQLRSRKWLRDNFLPARVGHGADAMYAAYDYLCGTGGRGFHKPGVGGFEQTTEVYFSDQSLGPDTFGEARNCWTKSPFIVLDGAKIPDMTTPDEEGRKSLGSLFCTAAHELFHVIQSTYVMYDDQVYLWFNEATAAVLENEAKAEYFARNVVTGWGPEIRSYDAFFQPLDYADPTDPPGVQKHGYGASYFLDFIRDRHTKGGKPREFLPMLLSNFSLGDGFIPRSLWQVTSGAQKGLEQDFKDFCRDRRDELIAVAPVKKVSPNKPFFIDLLEEARPLCVTAFRVEVNPKDFADGALKGASLAVLDTSCLIDGVTTSWRSIGSKWTDAKPEVCAAVPLADDPKVKRLSTLRCEPYAQAPQIKPRGTVVFVLAQPQHPPTARIIRDKLEIRILDTPLRRVTLPSLGNCLRGYMLYVRGPYNDTLTLGPAIPTSGDETIFAVSETDLRAKLCGGNVGPCTLNITYAECPAGSSNLIGPESKPLTLTLGELAWKLVWGSLPDGWTVSNGPPSRENPVFLPSPGEMLLVDNPKFPKNLLYFRYASTPVTGYDIRGIIEITSARKRDYSTKEKIEAGFRDSKGVITPGFQGTKEVQFQGHRAIRYDVGAQYEWGYMVEIDPALNLWVSILCHVQARYNGPRDAGPSDEDRLSKQKELKKMVDGYLGKYIRIESEPASP